MSIMSMHSTTSPSRFRATLSTALISATYLGQFTSGHIHSGEFSHPLFTAAAAVTSRQSKAGKTMPEIASPLYAPGFRRLAKSPWTMVWIAQRVPLAALCFLAESELVGSALSHYGMPVVDVSSVSTKMPRLSVGGAGRGREFWLVALLWHSSTFLLGLCWGVGLLIGHRASPMSFVNRSISDWSPVQLMKLFLVRTGAGNVAAWPAAAPPHRSHRSSHQAAALCMSRPPSIHDIDNDIVLLFSFFQAAQRLSVLFPLTPPETLMLGTPTIKQNETNTEKRASTSHKSENTTFKKQLPRFERTRSITC